MRMFVCWYSSYLYRTLCHQVLSIFLLLTRVPNRLYHVTHVPDINLLHHPRSASISTNVFFNWLIKHSYLSYNWERPKVWSSYKSLRHFGPSFGRGQGPHRQTLVQCLSFFLKQDKMENPTFHTRRIAPKRVTSFRPSLRHWARQHS